MQAGRPGTRRLRRAAHRDGLPAPAPDRPLRNGRKLRRTRTRRVSTAIRSARNSARSWRQALQAWIGNDRYFRLHRCRRRLGGLRARQPADGQRPPQGAMLEAGPRHRSVDPLRWATGSFSPSRAPTGATIRSPSRQLNNRRIFTPRGKVLGGSSSINGLVYIRGQREDSTSGAWRAGSRRPAALHQVRGPERGADEWHRRRPAQASGICRTRTSLPMRSSSRPRPGDPENRDFNGAKQEGVGYYQATTRKGRGAHSGGLPEAVLSGRTCAWRRRPGNAVPSKAFAQQVSNTAARAGAHRTRGARSDPRWRGVNSPQLMQLRAWGAGAARKPRHSPLLSTRQASRALQDHLYVRPSGVAREAITLNDDMMSLWRRWGSGSILRHKRGPLTISAGLAAALPGQAGRAAAYGAVLFHQFFHAEGGGLLLRSRVYCSLSQLRASRAAMCASNRPIPPRRRRSSTTTSRPRTTPDDGRRLKLLRKMVNTEPLRSYVVKEDYPARRLRATTIG